MNIDNNLILIKGEDKTASVTHWRYDKYKPVIFITFHDGKEYPYNTANVRFFKDPKEIFLEDRIALKNENPLTGAICLQIFGRYCRVVYNTGRRELVSTSSIRIVKSALHDLESRNCFAYLRQIAIQIGLVVQERNILANIYDGIRFVREDSILAVFLRGKNEMEKATAQKNIPIVYPFGFNLSQRKAVENALCNPISIIEGPPGTGKTQTILNIIANAVMRGESVAVVSSNNSATANVFEKLKKYGVEFIALRLATWQIEKLFWRNKSFICLIWRHGNNPRMPYRISELLKSTLIMLWKFKTVFPGVRQS